MRSRIRLYLGYGIDIGFPDVSVSIPNGLTGRPRMCQRNGKYRQVSSGIKGRWRLVHTIN
ncbi:hypothetical protein F383_00266 [Gossypium arboreum]|uniref:Uncharacterized protein n=1 Tax=Gossypium arboreum TaxID=29729 RepID=A0A0B0P0J2_GOSAR|nr:hypothetical protein F383_00266 [Gossypium arboreum]